MTSTRLPIIEWPGEQRADDAPPELLFLLFHGVGAGPRDMAPLAARLLAEYPQAICAGVAAPDPFDGVPGATGGTQWFSIRGITEALRPARVAEALPGFVQTVRALQRHYGVGWAHTALAGFSQGAIMALEAVQAEPRLAGRVLAFSGRHASLPAHAPADTSVHLLHGLADTVVSAQAAVEGARRLVALGGDVTCDALPGIGHELHPQLVERAVEQLRGFLPKRMWREAMGEAPITSRVASSRELGGPD